MVIFRYGNKEGEKRGGYRMNQEELGNGDKRIIMVLLAYNEKQLKELEENDGDIDLINRKKKNIKLYIEQLKELG